MERAHLAPFRERAPDGVHQGRASRRPEKLLEIHREHFDVALFRGNQDVLDVLVDGDERPRLDVVVAAVLHQVLDRLPGLREELDLVEHDQRVALVERHVRERRQVGEERVEVRQVLDEKILDAIPGNGEVDDRVGLVFRLRERFDDETLPHATGAVDQQRARTGIVLLPVKERVVDFPSEHSCVPFWRKF